MKTLILIAALCAGCSVYNSTAFQASTLALAEGSLAADWHSTSSAADSGWRGTNEANPIMGSHPTAGTVDAYMAGCMVLTAASYKVLPRWARPIAYLALAAFEISTVNDNMKAGTSW